MSPGLQHDFCTASDSSRTPTRNTPKPINKARKSRVRQCVQSPRLTLSSASDKKRGPSVAWQTIEHLCIKHVVLVLLLLVLVSLCTKATNQNCLPFTSTYRHDCCS